MQDNQRIVVAPGVFDILHIGHVRFLNEAKSYGTKLIVSLLSDEAVTEFKTKPPVMTYDERKELIESINAVDMVVCQKHNDIEATLRELTDLGFKPDILVRSSENKFNHGLEYMDEICGHIAIIPYTNFISSTEIKERVNGRGGCIKSEDNCA